MSLLLEKNKIAVLVISRFNSKRLKNKASLKINNLFILDILIKRLINNINIENLILCTSKSNNNIIFYKTIAKKNNIKVFFGSNLNVLKRIIDCLERFNFKHFVRVTGDNILTDVQSILPMCKFHIKNKNDYTFNDSLPRGTRVEIFSLSALKRNYFFIKDLNSTEYLTYFFKRKDIYKIKKKNFKKYFKNQHLYSISIDTIEDFKILKNFLKNRNILNINKKQMIDYLIRHSRQKKEITKIKMVTKFYDVRYLIDENKQRKFLLLN